jgi:hypothetical protein
MADMVNRGKPSTSENVKSLRARFTINMLEGVFKFLVLKLIKRTNYVLICFFNRWNGSNYTIFIESIIALVFKYIQERIFTFGIPGYLFM